jgi:hypothetical protein
MILKLPSHSYTTFGLIDPRVNPWYFVYDRIKGKGMKKKFTQSRICVNPFLNSFGDEGRENQNE